MREDVLDSRKRQYLLEIVRTGSIRAAAEVLDMDPSVLSRAVALMEQGCGMPLFERQGRGMVPTEAGRLMADFARRASQLRHDLSVELDGLREGAEGHVDVASGEGFLEWLCHDVLPTFWQEHPAVTVTVDVRPTHAIVQALLGDSVHIGLALQPVMDDRLSSHACALRPFRVLVPRHHPLTQLARPLRLIDLAPYRGAAMQAAFGAQQRIAQVAATEQVMLEPLLVTGSFKSLEYFVAAGCGYAISPMIDDLARLRRRGIACLPLAHPSFNEARMQVLSRAGRPLSVAARQLIAAIGQHIDRPAR